MKKTALLLTVLLACLLCPAIAAEGLAWTLYVNEATGIDAPFRGFSPGRPLKTISYAVKRSFGEVTIKVAAGSYMENIVIDRILKLNLEGDGAGTTIAGNGSGAMIYVTGPSRVMIRDVTIQSGAYGIIGRDGASLEVRDVTLQDHLYHGVVMVHSSSAIIDACRIVHNGGSGIQIHNSSVSVYNNTIDSNQGYGIKMVTAGHARIGLGWDELSKGNIITANGMDGIGIFNGADAFIFDNTIRDNQRHGINISRAAARIMGQNIIESNARHGMRIANGGNVYQGRGDLPTSSSLDLIRNNQRHGIYAGNNASVRIHEIDISHNMGNGIFLDFHSTLHIIDSTIASNAFAGIVVARDSGLYLDDSVNIAGHGTGIECLDGESSYSGGTGGVVDPIGPACSGY